MASQLRRVRELLEGRPPALPVPLDRLAERWAGLPPRGRLGLVAVGAILVLFVAGSGAARSPWGHPVEVLVATRDLAVGHRLEPDDLRRATWPSDLAPPAPTAPVGRTLSTGLPAGMPLSAGHLHGDGLARHLTAGEVAFPLPLDEGRDLEPGQVVDLVAGDASGGGTRLSAGARVLATDGEVAWVAVDRDDAPGLAGAAAWGRIVAVPLGGG